jgi:TolB-like protein
MFKRLFTITVLFSFLFTIVFNDLTLLIAQDKKIPRIAVFDFDDTNAAAKNEGYGEAISGMLMTELINGKIFYVIERNEIERMMNEMAFQVSGAVDTKTAKQIGEILGVDILVFGTVAKFGSLVETDIRLIDTESGKALLAENASSKSGLEIRTMVENLARKIEQRYLGRLVEEVRIYSNPTGATVFIDGVNEGTTPLVKNLNQGNHKIRIVKPNYTIWDETVVVVKGGGKIEASLKLSPEFQQKKLAEKEADEQRKQQLAAEQAQKQRQPESKKSGGSKTMLYILGGAVLVGGIAAAAVLAGKKDEKQEESTNSTVSIRVDL